jgi:hypothetical protein
VTWCSQVKKMETGGSMMMRDKGTLFMGDVECTLLLANDSSVMAAKGQVMVVVVVVVVVVAAAAAAAEAPTYFQDGEIIGVADVTRHAEVLGLALPAEDGLLWIVEAALKEPLPQHWQKLTDALGRVFYYHATTGRKSIERPQDSYFRCLLSGALSL